jgi:membrane-bound lytic murein transglycosylase D
MGFKQLPLLHKITQPIIFFLLFVVLYILLKVYILAPTPNTVSYTDSNFSVLGLNIPANLHFCGEKIPSNDFEIKKDLEKEFFNNNYWKTNSVILFHKAQRWFPYIEPILKQEGIPDDFKYLAVIESHLSNVTSPVGAAGFWQLVPITAGYFGLEVNAEVDERYDVEKATRTACQLLKQAYKVFKNWTLTAAAYNRGIGGIINAMKQQHTDNYYDLMLNSETASFIYRILAYKTLFSSPGHFGIKKRSWNYYPKVPYHVHKVDSSITNLAAFATHINSTVGTIKLFNPWLLKTTLHNPGNKTYLIKVPRDNGDYSGYARDLLAAEGNLIQYASNPTVLQNMNADSVNLIGRKTIYHVVRVEEPLKDLAAFFKVTEEDLRKWNNLGDAVNAVEGQTLTIYYNKDEVKKGE